MADKMRKVNLDALDEPRPPTMRYHAQYEVVMEFLSRAGAMLEFAGQLGLPFAVLSEPQRAKA